MSLWIALRLVKFLALAALAAGVGLAAGQPQQRDRANAAFFLATPALWVAFVVGWLLMKTGGRSFHDPFVGLGAVAGLSGLHGSVLAASKPSPRLVSRWIGPAGLAAATAIMVTRDAGGVVMFGSVIAAISAAAALVAVIPEPDGAAFEGFPAVTRRWFVNIARLEGLSLIAMVLVAMPIRHLTGVSLDGGTGALGWGHGVLVLLYLQGLMVVARACQWSAKSVGLAFVASLLPFGTFVFERFGLPAE